MRVSAIRAHHPPPTRHTDAGILCPGCIKCQLWPLGVSEARCVTEICFYPLDTGMRVVTPPPNCFLRLRDPSSGRTGY